MRTWILLSGVVVASGGIALEARSAPYQASGKNDDRRQQARDLYNKGLSAEKEGDYTSALASFEASLRLFPDTPVVRYKVGVCQAQLGRNDAAAASLKTYLANESDGPEAEDARRRVEKLLLPKLDATQREALEEANAYLEVNVPGTPYRKALVILKRLAGQVPGYLPIHRQIGRANEALERYDEAARAYGAYLDGYKKLGYAPSDRSEILKARVRCESLDETARAKKAKRIEGVVSLTGPTVWDLSSLSLAAGARIVTHGHPLKILVAGDLTIEDEAIVQAWETAPAPPRAPARVPAKAASGGSYNPGPDTDGAGGHSNGAAGGAGSSGTAGEPGRPGVAAGPVTILVRGKASGVLKVVNRGGPGGDGGPGGAGGDGGNGQQGGPGKQPDASVLGINIGAEDPGHGGAGGSGGNGGAGGVGGAGGDGGDLSVEVQGNQTAFHLTADLAGGLPGKGGQGGAPGTGGTPGFGGKGVFGVVGRVQEFRGQPGAAGQAGAQGSSGSPGKTGTYRGNVKSRD